MYWGGICEATTHSAVRLKEQNPRWKNTARSQKKTDQIQEAHRKDKRQMVPVWAVFRTACISTSGSFTKQDLTFHKASSSVPKQEWSQ